MMINVATMSDSFDLFPQHFYVAFFSFSSCEYVFSALNVLGHFSILLIFVITLV